MPLPLIVWAVIELAVVAAARVAARVIVKAAPKVIKEVAKKASKIVRMVAKRAKSAKPKGNTKGKGHKGKKKREKNDCKAALKKYPVHAYEDKELHCNSKINQSHHVMQNAHFMVNDQSIDTICPTYTRDDAPCIPLGGKSTDYTKPHGMATKAQNADSKIARASGIKPTFSEAKANAKRHLKVAGLSPKEINCIMIEVDKKMKKLCPGITESTKLRIPAR